MLKRTKLRIAAVFSAIAAFFLSFFSFQNTTKAEPEKRTIMEIETSQVRTRPSGAYDRVAAPQSVKTRPSGAYDRVATPVSVKTRPSGAYDRVAAPAYVKSRPSGAYDRVAAPLPSSKYNQDGSITTFDVSKFLGSQAEVDAFKNHCIELGIAAPDFDDLQLFQMNQIVQRLEAIEKELK